VGDAVGPGVPVPVAVGRSVGVGVGTSDGAAVGLAVGAGVAGCEVGDAVGRGVGSQVGEGVGAGVGTDPPPAGDTPPPRANGEAGAATAAAASATPPASAPREAARRRRRPRPARHDLRDRRGGAGDPALGEGGEDVVHRWLSPSVSGPSSSASRRRERDSSEPTVPVDTPMAAATCGSVRSATYRRTTAVRALGDSSRSAAQMSSRGSTAAAPA
jgi:hypothetical protein